jgi:hypothetical protein
MTGKYAPLQRYLLTLPPAVQEVTLTFAEIEHIIATALPPSARDGSFWVSSGAEWNWQQAGFAAHLRRGGLVAEPAVCFTRQAPRRR